MKMNVLLSVVVLASFWSLAYSQGPRNCKTCTKVEEIIGSKLGVHISTIGVRQLTKMCPKLEDKVSTEYCKYISSTWQKILEADKASSTRQPTTTSSSTTGVLNLIWKWIWSIFDSGDISDAGLDYHMLCKLADICKEKDRTDDGNI